MHKRATLYNTQWVLTIFILPLRKQIEQSKIPSLLEVHYRHLPSSWIVPIEDRVASNSDIFHGTAGPSECYQKEALGGSISELLSF